MEGRASSYRPWPRPKADIRARGGRKAGTESHQGWAASGRLEIPGNEVSQLPLCRHVLTMFVTMFVNNWLVKLTLAKDINNG